MVKYILIQRLNSLKLAYNAKCFNRHLNALRRHGTYEKIVKYFSTFIVLQKLNQKK